VLCTHGGGEGAPWGFFNVLGLGLGKGRGPPTRTMAGWVGELRPSCHRHRHVEPWMAGGDPTALRVQPGPRTAGLRELGDVVQGTAQLLAPDPASYCCNWDVG
jgi:hypothetical protein